jgi:hypothetical protein
MRRQRCFVIIPFGDEFEDVLADIRSVLDELGLECRRGDHHKRPGAVMGQIERDIRRADLILAEGSGVVTYDPIDQTAAIEQLQAVCQHYRDSIGPAWDETIFSLNRENETSPRQAERVLCS